MGGTTLVTGGTGTLGREVVALLQAGNNPVRVLSRRPRRGSDPSVEWAVGELGKNVGLDDALTDVDTVLHCATVTNRPSAKADVVMMGNLIAAARRSSVPPRIVYISIVGVDLIPFPYYKGKLAAEQLLEASGLPYTILRTTQFHNLIAGLVGGLARVPGILPHPKGLRFQPVAVQEAAARLVEVTVGQAAQRVPDMGGPEVWTLEELAASYLEHTGKKRRLVGVPVGGKAVRAFRAGHNLAPEHADGAGTWEEFLTAHVPAGNQG
jgi:uncharacterized protein YbjT (DUF2867 family)